MSSGELQFPERSRFGLAALDNKVYVLGGRGLTSLMCQNDVDVYNINTKKWRVGVPMNINRSSLGVAVLRNRFYAVNIMILYKFGKSEYKSGIFVLKFGGHNNNMISETLETVEVFNPETQIWDDVAPMTIGRADMGVGVLNDKLYVVSKNYSVSVELTNFYYPT